jgi:tetratricopeptide (TPR) repeat protein
VSSIDQICHYIFLEAEICLYFCGLVLVGIGVATGRSALVMRQKVKKNSLPHQRLPSGLEDQARGAQMLEGNSSDRDLLASLWERALFYERHQKWELAQAIVQIILHLVEEPEDEARCFLVMGQLAERQGECDEAVQYYAAGLALGPTAKNVVYLLHNNMGYCLSRRGEHAQAERHCQMAVALEPQKHNAWNNLGVSLEGQEDFLGAAWAYLEARKADASDERSNALMRGLLTRHPELKGEIFRMLNSGAASDGEQVGAPNADHEGQSVRRAQNG